jgi:hypothetical protein
MRTHCHSIKRMLWSLVWIWVSDRWGPMFKERANVKYILMVLLVVLAVSAIGEIAARLLPWPTPSPGGISDPANVLLAAKRAQGNPFVLVLGDSVMGSSAMENAGIPNAFSHTIPRRFEGLVKRVSDDATVTNLAMDGALAADYLGLLQLLTEHQLRPAATVIQVDYRVLSPLHDEEDTGNLSRPWLRPYVAPWAGSVMPRDISAASSERPIDGFIGRTILLRSDAYLRLRNLHSGVLTAQSAPIAAANREQYAEILRMTVGRYYLNEKEITTSAAISTFQILMDRLRRLGIPTIVYLTPANPEFLGNQINRPVYAYNVNAFGEWFRRRYGATSFLRLVSLENIFTSSDFLDHCHLTAEANAKAAKIMFDEFVLLNEARG